RITQELVFPSSVKVFGGRAEAVELKRDNLSIHVHGLSFAKPHAPESLHEKYRRPLPDAVNIGIMRTSLCGANGHVVLAVRKVIDLDGRGSDYWVMGREHALTRLEVQRTVLMPGMPIAIETSEGAAKTDSLVPMHDNRRETVEK